MLILNTNTGLRDTTRTTLLRRNIVRDTSTRVRLLQRNLVTSPTMVRQTLSGSSFHWAQYAQQAYQRGVERAYTLAKRLVPRDEFDILKRNFLKEMQRDIVSSGQQLGDRIYNEMEGVGSQVATRVSRAVADARSKGLGTTDRQQAVSQALATGHGLASRVVHTELTRAFAEGQLDAYDRLGIAQLELNVEWQALGPNPCPQCSAFDGTELTIEEAKGLIPFHPYCMCSWEPILD